MVQFCTMPKTKASEMKTSVFLWDIVKKLSCTYTFALLNFLTHIPVLLSITIDADAETPRKSYVATMI